MSQTAYVKHLVPSFLLAILTSFVLTSCNDDDGIDGPVEIALWDIVTYEGKGSDGKGSVFTLRQVDDSPLVTLTSTSGLQDIEAPTRLMIRYIPEGGEAYVSDRIQLLGASKINTGEAATEWKDDYDNWNRDKVFLYSAWRTGTYINFHLRLTYSTEPRIFNLVLDPDTRQSETPEFYLVHIMAEETDYHDRAYFASFDIGEIWNDPKTKGVKIHIADTNLNKDIFTFYKNN
ncbi:NigD-like C-terminal domain-containing protein [uncultured Duncaniella sp.]|uniref:NigD1/NigD2 family lipoprotein n=1 Tax=uncultured Duncaniella sp. TaxID=2768039 RepID=UPI0025CF90B3|nr:NigD-like C-terminal domain-containing protein [uncultured Duncaniella sp.]